MSSTTIVVVMAVIVGMTRSESPKSGCMQIYSAEVACAQSKPSPQ